MRTALKNRVQAPDRPAGHPVRPRRPVRPVAAASWTSSSCGPTRARLGTLLRLIADFDREIDALADEIDRRATHDPRVDVLRQISGSGRSLGMLIVAEIWRPPPVRLGRTDSDRAPLGRPDAARPHLPPRLGGAALGARRGRPEGLPGRRTAAPRLRTDRQTPRPHDRQGRVARKILTLCYYALRDGEIRCLRRPGRASALKVTAPSS
jgi:hypothetical protein